MIIKMNIEFFSAFVIMLILAPIFIPILHKFKFGQTIRNEGPESHLVKNGTPTMGGIMIIAAFAIPTILFLFGEGQKEVLPAFLMTLLFGLVGFLDDFLKVKKKNSTGLRAWQKMSLQIVFTIAVLAYMYFLTDIPMTLKVPFVPGLELNLGIFILFFDF
ncbi:MAG: phospho-N-acetylmuramoyl-pentapeptide-transferase, partial [Lachnospiraceae bacterium]|nr:phospho-N-acetylmuramoyl-pentapeptide-transferase [Lachnospiraceae bacterium]